MLEWYSLPGQLAIKHNAYECLCGTAYQDSSLVLAVWPLTAAFSHGPCKCSSSTASGNASAFRKSMHRHN